MNSAIKLEKANKKIRKKVSRPDGSRIRIARRGSVELVSQASQSLTCCLDSKDRYEGPSKTFN